MKKIDIEQEFDSWNTQKKIINNKKTKIYFREGDIWWISLGVNICSESYGKGESFRRPILVFKKLSDSTCISIPLSSKIKQGSWFCQYSLHGEVGTALLYQVRMIHKNRFQRKMGEIDKRDFEEIKKKFNMLLNSS